MNPRVKATTISLLSAIGFFGIFSTTISKNPVLPAFPEIDGRGCGRHRRHRGYLAFGGHPFQLSGRTPGGQAWEKTAAPHFGFRFPVQPLSCTSLCRILGRSSPSGFFHGIATAILGPVSAAILLSEYKERKGEMLGNLFLGDPCGPDLGSNARRRDSSPFFVGLSDGWDYRLRVCGGLSARRTRFHPVFPDEERSFRRVRGQKSDARGLRREPAHLRDERTASGNGPGGNGNLLHLWGL